MQRNKIISFFALAMILGTVIVGNATVSGRTTGFLSVQGTWIVDSTGTPILLRGVNYPGYDSLYPRSHPESAYANFAKMGFNVVRLQISWASLERYKGRFDDYFLSFYVGRDVQWAKKYGLHIVLDMHQYQWASKFGGGGVPDWAVAKYPANELGLREAVSDFWADPSLQDHLIMVWKGIATRYANEPTIVGYDLLNEPWIYTSIIPELNATHIDAFYAKTTQAIRAVDPNHIIFLEPANMNTFNTSFDSNIVWAPHFYPLSYASTYYPENQTVLELKMDAMYQNYVTRSNAPLWMGEFGAFMTDGTANNWLKEAQALFNKYQIGWAWWAYGDQRDGGTVPNCLHNPDTTAPSTVPLIIVQIGNSTRSWFRTCPAFQRIIWSRANRASLR
jgi:endoglycosylceramidase